MSDNFRYRPGLNNVGNYQISGIPFATGSLTAPLTSSAPLVIEFPSVTQRIWIHNRSSTSDLRVGFSANGITTGTNYYVIDSDSGNDTSVPQELRVRATKIYLVSNNGVVCTPIAIFAELTGITGYDLDAAYSGAVGIG